MLRINGARKLFHRGTPDARPALDGLGLHLVPGDFAVIVGSNGAGKSTLLNAIAGSIRLDSGQIWIAGRDVTQLAEHRRAGAVARVFQDPAIGTMPALTVAENLALAAKRGQRRGLRLALPHHGQAALRAALLPFGLGLEDRLADRAGLLSGGQRQCVALAMAVISRPDILLLDEHTAALDPITAERVMQATTDIVARHGLTTLMITHNMQHAIATGSRLLMLHAGRVQLDLDAPARIGMNVPDLVSRFHLATDRILL